MQKFANKFKGYFKPLNDQLIKFNKTERRAAYVKTNIVYGGDLPNPTPNQSFGSLLFSRMLLQERREDIFQISAVSRDVMTTKECLEKSVALAKRFQEEGVQNGDFILLVGNNSFNMNIALIGTFFLGAVPLPLTSKTSLDEFQNIVKILKPKYFGCDRKYLFSFKKALADFSDFDVSKIFLLNQWLPQFQDFSNEPDTTVAFPDFIKGREKDFESFQPAEVNDPKSDLALVLKTNSENIDGKLIGITHYNLNSVVARFDFLDNQRNLKEEIVLLVQKVMWMSGLYCLLLSCCYGSKLIVMDKFEEESFMKAVEEFRVTTTFLYYPKCWQLLKYTCNCMYDLSSCKHFYSIDGSLPSFFMNRLEEKLGIRPKNSYGFPEFCGLVLEELGDAKKGSTGKLVPQSYGKVISDDTFKIAGPNEKGELCFKGPTLCKGYINDEKGYRNSLDKDGFFLTGHYGYYDEDGEFFLIDRIIHQIQYKNYKISPKELEAIIKSLDSVKDVCVAGLQHETDGAYPIAFVSLQKGQNITEQDIIKYVNEKVPDFKRIRGVIFITKIPRFRDSGGINRRMFKKALSKFRVKANSDNPEIFNVKVQSSDAEQKKADEQINS